MDSKNRRILLAARPVGLPQPSDFELAEGPVPELGPGEMLVRGLYLSVDPYMRGLMGEGRSYAEPFELGEVVPAGAVGRVVHSNLSGYVGGDYVVGPFGWQEYALSTGEGVRRVDPAIAPVSTALGVLGMPGLTAYFGLLDVGRPQAGETVVVSGAAGAVGAIAGQIARIQGCRVVGSAGTDEKVRHLTEDLGFDAAFNYKTENPLEALRRHCPDGIDVYFDNVGGIMTDCVLGLINTGARVALCGQISQYNLKRPERAPRMLWALIVKQARAEGFLVFQFAERYAEGLLQLSQWLREGKLVYRESVTEGIERTPEAFIGMLQGSNVGKQLVKLA